MSTPKFTERHRRNLVPVAALLLVAGYLFVLLPLSRHAAGQKEPLDKAGRALAGLLGQTNNPTLDFQSITNQLAATRAALTTLESVRQQAAARVELGAAVRDRMKLPFQLVDYENERGRQQGLLQQLARQKKVTLAPTVLEELPAHTYAVTEPNMLWAELAVVESLLATAVHCQVGTIHSLQVPVTFTNFPPLAGSRTFTEIPMQIEFTAPAPAATRFLQSLPLRGAELAAAGLPVSSTNKPAMFVDRLLVRKQTPETLEEVRASVRVVGFIFHD
jgi:hypothetical protein